MILAHQRLRPKAASCVNQNPAKCVLAHKIEAELAVLLCTLPMALVGSVWLIYWQDYHFSIAVGVGFIALAGVAVETCVIMLVYLNQSWQQVSDTRQGLTDDELKDSIVAGAGLRVRPVLMTACATIAGLIPILMGSGTDSKVMSRLATPMVGE